MWTGILKDSNNKIINVGDKVFDRDGKAATVKGWREPHKPSSTGRVYVVWDGSNQEWEYFPTVFNLHIDKEES